MRKLSLLPVTIHERGRYWQVTVPLRPAGRKQVTFKRKADAEKYFKACRIELRRTGRVELLSSRQALVDAVEAARMLKGVKGRSKMREAAALYLEAKTAIAKLRGEIPSAPYTESHDRMIELTPGLHKVLSGMAAKRGVSLSELAAGMLQQSLIAEGALKLPPLEGMRCGGFATACSKRLRAVVVRA